MTICTMGRVNAKSPVACSECKTPWVQGPNGMHLGGGTWLLSWHPGCLCPKAHGIIRPLKRKRGAA